MGKFSALLLASDFDDTLLPTSHLAAQGAAAREISRENREALSYFIAQGGHFTVSTGRSAATFAPYAQSIPMNAPAIVSGGGALYDYHSQRYQYFTYLCPESCSDLAILSARFPEAALELYHKGEEVCILHPNAFSEAHCRVTGTLLHQVSSVDAAAPPFHKALFEGDASCLQNLANFMKNKGMTARYELIFASPNMLELTARGADKGTMLLRLAAMLGIARCGVCAVGDHCNDLPMLRAASFAFAPKNAVQEVRALAGICIVRSAHEHALQDVVARLEQRFSPAMPDVPAVSE